MFNARILLSACGLLLAGSNSGHAAAMVTGWMSPQCGQIWHPGVWWDLSPNWLKIWHTEYSLPRSSGWKSTHIHTWAFTHRQTQFSTSAYRNSRSPWTYVLTRHRASHTADWSWCSSTLCLFAPASCWNAYSISWVLNHANLCTHAQKSYSYHVHCSSFGSMLLISCEPYLRCLIVCFSIKGL